MSRYIDADKLAMHLADYQYSIPYGCIDESAEDMGAYMAVGECLKAIDEQPSIDICFCRECKYSEKTSSPITALWCKRFGLEDMAVEADDFCSYGSRSEKPNNSTISKMEQVGKE